MDPLEMISENVSKIFDKIDKLASQNAVTTALLPRIEKQLDEIPKLDKRVLRIESIWTFIIGVSALLGIAVSVTKLAGLW